MTRTLAEIEATGVAWCTEEEFAFVFRELRLAREQLQVARRERERAEREVWAQKTSH